MDTIQVGLQSLSKSSIDEPWKITFLTPVDNVEMTVSLDKVGVGPRFREVLSLLEKYQVYPRTITGIELEKLGMTTRDSFVIKFLVNVPAHVEISFRTLRQFRRPAAPKLKGELREEHYNPKSTLESDPFTIQEITQGGGPPTKQNFKSTISNTDYLVVVEPILIKDGDTVDFKVIQAGPKADDDDAIKPGKKITIRFAGMNAPETREHGIEQGLTRDEDYCNAYDVDADVAFDIGDESWHFVEDQLKNHDGLIVLDVDADLAGRPKKDKYGRFVAAIYLTDLSNPDDIANPFTTTVLNKVLMGTLTKIVPKGATAAPKAPLAMPYYYFTDNEYSRIPTKDWLYELGIRKESDEKIGDKIKETDRKLGNKEAADTTTLKNGDWVQVKAPQAYNNQIDYMEPYDDRFEKFFANGLDHRVRIGDVMLTIPPLSIDVNRVGSIRKIKTLRSKSSMLIKGGSSATTLTLQLYFHDLDSINGTKVKMHKDMDRNYYMDGLRPLIAQFKKAPFLPIDNKYINETLGIDSVALVNLSIQTVPGFPHSLAANLTLAKFDHTAYMPQLPRLGDGINYPMFRWYYQEPMRDDVAEEDRSPYRTYLQPIPDTGLTNDFKWLMVSEEDLKARKQAIESIRQMTNPLIAEERFMDPTTTLGSGGNGSDANTLLGKEYKDGVAAQKVIDQYNRYLAQKKAGKVSKKRKDDGTMSVDDEISSDTFNKQGKAVFKAIYGDNATDSSVTKVSHYAPFESHISRSETLSGQVGLEKGWPEKNNGSIFLRLYSQKNVDLFPKEYHTGSLGDELYGVLAPGTYIDEVKKILSRGKAAEETYTTGIEEWYKADAVIKATEAKLNLVELQMPGTIIPTNVSIMYENQFSNIQLQALDGPSFQFMGGQDPYIQVSFEADDLGVEGIRAMLEQTETYAREYRTGITSGFLGVKNHLLQLFGVDTIMPETVQFRTVPGFPGRYQIEMTLCGFDKTQKRTEQLEGLSPIYGDKVPSREDRKAGNYSQAADEAVIELKMASLELYPDLEMPTYDELISVLPYLNANCDVYENKTGGIYLDPDFYMATPQTMREFIREESDKEHVLKMNDFTGVEMTTSSKGTSPLDGDASMWQILNSVDSRTERVPTNFSWSGGVEDKDGGDQNKNGVTFKSKDVEEYVKSRDKIKEFPSKEEWDSWGLGNYYRDYNTWKKQAQPTELEVYRYIYKRVDALWVEKGLVYNDKNVDIKNDAWQKVTYAKADDLWDAEWNRLAKKDPNALKKGQKKVHETKISDSDYKVTKSKVPRERIANIIKAILHARSKWQQLFASGMPRIDAQGNAAGIMGVPISSEAGDVATAKRLLWDWRYNMDFGLYQLLEAYNAALDEKALEYKCRPWEWMVSAFATGTIKQDLQNSFWEQVNGILNSRYNSYEQMYATPTSTMSLPIMQEKMGYSAHQMGVIEGNKEDLIQELLDLGYRTVKEEHWYGDEEDSKADTKKKLEKKDSGALRKIYDDYVKEKFDGKANQYVAGKAGQEYMAAKGMEESNNKRALPKAQKETLDAYTETNQYIDNAVNKRLVNQQDPQEIFPQMFTDMIEYDMRMRFVRAFPTFQMFIVDEGKWLTNYRLWDNLYGFNAITSIDIHKSRKIAADTAVIEMTNVYSNLTSRSMDTSFDEWDYKFWDNLVFGNPNEKLLEARKEMLSSMLLQVGARIHLRLGYGSSATNLPVVFNGTITEMNADEMVQIVCQGDGVELGNVISGDPDDNNKGLFHVEEPRDLLCELLTSKGNWLKDIINYESGGSLFKDNPLGIMHFGQPTGEVVPDGTLDFFNENYGEAAQNIYSSNGVPTFSQYYMPDGSDIPWSFGESPMMKWLQHGDEANIVVPFYNNTYWDIAQTLAYCSPDYIAQVHPFEMRSTFFFGKPYWLMAYRYDSKYEYNEEQKAWIRIREVEYRKPFQQIHLFDSYTDIVGNSIKASEDGMSTVVIVNYDGKQVGPIYADFDIRFDKQKTTVVDAQIVSRMKGLDFWTSEKQAMYYGMSALRDYIKDMYQGELVVMGDPTIKPHDICYMNDIMYDMNGQFLVKAVTHHFSQETGFITSVQPDAHTVNDDMAMIAMGDWLAAFAGKAISFSLGFTVGAKALKKAISSSVMSKAIKYGKNGSQWATEQSLVNLAKALPDGDEDVKLFKETINLIRKGNLSAAERAEWLKDLTSQSKGLESKMADWEAKGLFKNEIGKDLKGLKSRRSMKLTVKAITKTTEALRDGAKAFKAIKVASSILALGGLVNPLATIASLGITWATETIAEKYRRKKAMMQAVLVQPMKYQGRDYTAGINGHKGMVVGDAMGKIDSFLSGYGLDGVEDNGGAEEWIMEAWNWLTEDPGKDYSISEEDLRNGNWKTSDK
jgi:endonuclease YncB( thermonuclease family)